MENVNKKIIEINLKIISQRMVVYPHIINISINEDVDMANFHHQYVYEVSYPDGSKEIIPARVAEPYCILPLRNIFTMKTRTHIQYLFLGLVYGIDRGLFKDMVNAEAEDVPNIFSEWIAGKIDSTITVIHYLSQLKGICRIIQHYENSDMVYGDCECSISIFVSVSKEEKDELMKTLMSFSDTINDPLGGVNPSSNH